MATARGPNEKGMRRFFREALAYCEEFDSEMLEHFRSPDEKRFKRLTREEFCCEYVWVVYGSGFDVSIIENLFPDLELAFKNFDIDAIAGMPSVDPVLAVFGNRRKAECIVRGAKYLASVDFSEYKRRLAKEGIALLTELPGIGPITRDLLARNIGLASVAKNDTWIRQLVACFGYSEHTSMIDSLAEYFGEKPGVVDLVLWRFCSDRVWESDGYDSLVSYVESL